VPPKNSIIDSTNSLYTFRISSFMHKRISRLSLILSCSCLPFSATAAFAAAGDATAVLSHCGTPTNDYATTSVVTGQAERNIVYGNVILHFDPTGGGWNYLSAWDGHTPISKAHVSRLMPCFSDALTEAAAAQITPLDPTIASDQAVAPVGIRFNRAFLILMFVLFGILIISVAIPATRRRRRRATLPITARPYRTPRVTGLRFRRRKT
jgi:hypothetical protein